MEHCAISQGEFARFQRFIFDIAGISMSDSKKALVSGRLAKRLQDCHCVADRDAFSQQILKYALDSGQRQQFRHQVLDHFGVLCSHPIQEFLGVLAREQLMRIPADQFGKVRTEHADGIDYRVTKRASALGLLGWNPVGLHPERRLPGLQSVDGMRRLPYGYREFTAVGQLPSGDLNSLERDDILTRTQREIVCDSNRRQQIAKITRHLFADSGNTAEKRGVRAAFHELYETEADLDRERVDVEQALNVVLRLWRGCGRLSCLNQIAFLTHLPTRCAESSAEEEKGDFRKSGKESKDHQHTAGEHERL